MTNFRPPILVFWLLATTILAPLVQAQIEGSVPINWDPGTVESGSEVTHSSGLVTGDFLFRISPETPDSGAWRTVLAITAGEADLYLRRSATPNPLESASITRRSTRTSGDEAILLPSSSFSVGEEWYILVRCVEAEWSLFSGDLFLRDLGELGFSDANENDTYEPTESVLPSDTGELTIGPEGLLFFRTEVPDGTPAWDLRSSDPNTRIHVRKGIAPLANAYDLRREGQMLVVPNYLQASSAGAAYFIALDGTPGDVISLRSSIHTYEAVEFDSMGTISGTEAGYKTFQVQVPPNQVAWEIQLTATEGDPNFALRRDQVPSEFENDAVSEAPAGVIDSVTLSPASGGGFGLSDGTFFITVYADAPYTAVLNSGDVTVDPISFEGVTTNSLPEKAGWRYFILDDLDSQTGLGWELLLEGAPPETEIAVRRNAIPSRWQYRRGGSSALLTSSGNLDRSVVGNRLQQPRHQRDVWYVGIFQPEQALGAFTLTSRKLVPTTIAFNGSAFDQPEHEAGLAQYYRVDVPFDALGWNFVMDQVIDAEELGRDAPCTVVIAKDALPSIESGELFRGPPLNREGSDWPAGAYWQVSTDWTKINRDNDGARRYALCLPTGQPLTPGTYYVGIVPSTVTTSYRIRNQGIGYGESWDLPINEVSFESPGDTHSIPPLGLGELHIVKVAVNEGSPSLTFDLNASSGDGFMAVKKGGIPNALARDSSTLDSSIGALYKKEGIDFLTLMPLSGREDVSAGDYFFTIVGEGVVPPEPEEGQPLEPRTPADLVLSYEGPLEVAVAGEVPLTGLDFPIDLEAGRLVPIDFTVPSQGVVAAQVTTVIESGNAGTAWWRGPTLRTPAPVSFDGKRYGYHGGEDGSSADDDIISRRYYTTTRPSIPMYSTETIGATFRALVRAEPNAPAEGTFQVRLFQSEALPFETPEPVDVAHQAEFDWRYFEIQVPEEGPLAWRIDVESITSVDEDPTKLGEVTAILRRDLAPPGIQPVSLSGDSWASGLHHQLTAGWTGRPSNPDGTKHLSAVYPMGQPLEPGRYILGVQAIKGDVAYKVRTRGIGPGYAIPITDLAPGASITIEDLKAREASFFRIQIAEGTPNWVMQATGGQADEDFQIVLGKGVFPGVGAQPGRASNVAHGTLISRSDYPGDLDFEEYVDLPSGGLHLPDSTYILAVVSEGSGGSATVLGTGSVDVLLEQPDPLPVQDVGTFVFGDEPSTGFALQPGGIGLFKLTVAEFSIDLGSSIWATDGKLGVRRLSLDTGIPKPAPVSAPDYGTEGGTNGVIPIQNGLCNPLPKGEHYFSIRALKDQTGAWQGAIGFIGMGACTELRRLDPRKGETSGGLSQGSWTFRRVDIPEGPDAWQLMTEAYQIDDAGNFQPGDFDLVIRRNALPVGGGASVQASSEEFPEGASFVVNQGADWTRLDRSPDNKRLHWSVIPMGRPLEPGSYVLGLYAKSTPIAYHIQSCLIGNEFDIPIHELPFDGADASSPLLTAPAKSAVYYKVTVPSNKRSWQIGIDATRGDWAMALRYGGLPGSQANAFNLPTEAHGFHSDKAGDEHLLFLPEPEPEEPPAEGEDPWEPYLKPGDYYIAVASKGATPASPRVGSEPAEGMLFSQGTIPVESIGTVTSAGLSSALDIPGGQSLALEFTVTTPMPALEFRFDGRSGNPEFALWTGNPDFLPRPPFKTDNYGSLGGEVDSLHRFEASAIHVLTNVSPGTYRMVGASEPFRKWLPQWAGDSNYFAQAQYLPRLWASTGHRGVASYAPGNSLAVPEECL